MSQHFNNMVSHSLDGWKHPITYHWIIDIQICRWMYSHYHIHPYTSFVPIGCSLFLLGFPFSSKLPPDCPGSTYYVYGGFLSHRGIPSHHPFLDGTFPEINHPASLGYPHCRKLPWICTKIYSAKMGSTRAYLLCRDHPVLLVSPFPPTVDVSIRKPMASQRFSLWNYPPSQYRVTINRNPD